MAKKRMDREEYLEGRVRKLSDKLVELSRLIRRRDAGSRALVDGLRASEKHAKADAEVSEAKEYLWRDKYSRLEQLVREKIGVIRIAATCADKIAGDSLHTDERLYAKIAAGELRELADLIEKEISNG